MNRNQKIAIGCGGAGCLGLLVVAVAGVGLYWYSRQPTMTSRNSNININSNRAANTNSSNTNSSESTDDTPSSSMSDDEKHRLFQAGSSTGDTELILRVNRKIGFNVASGSDYQDFIRDHISWSFSNADFIVSVSTPEKARAYVEEHLDD